MDKTTLLSELETIIGGYLKDKGLELVELSYKYEGSGFVLRILTDRPEGGINIDDCFYLNRQLSVLLDEKGLLKDRYILEVSSPGIDRPLKTMNDFLRCRNRTVQFFLKELVGGRLEWTGKIIAASEDAVHIDHDGQVITLPLASISKATQTL